MCSSDLFMTFQVEYDAEVTATDATFYGMRVEYTPKMYKGHIVEAPAFQNDN